MSETPHKRAPNGRSAPPRRHVYTVPTPEDTYGHRIRSERLARGWDQTELAAMLGSEQTVISALERNARKAPNPVLLTQLEELFGLPPKTLTDLARWTNPLHLPQPGDVIIPSARDGIEELARIAQALPRTSFDILLERAHFLQRDIETRAALEATRQEQEDEAAQRVDTGS